MVKVRRFCVVKAGKSNNDNNDNNDKRCITSYHVQYVFVAFLWDDV